MKNKWGPYIFWMIGIFIMLDGIGRVENAVRRYQMNTFHVAGGMWINWGIQFLIGIYLSLLFLHGPKQINLPLFLCVFVPSTILSLYFPVSFTLGLPIPIWLATLLKFPFTAILSGFSKFPFTAILSGFSLMLAFFGRTALSFRFEDERGKE